MFRETRGRGSSAKATTPKMVSTKVKMASNKRLLEVLGLQGWPNAMLNDTLKTEGRCWPCFGGRTQGYWGCLRSLSHTLNSAQEDKQWRRWAQGLEEDVREGRIGRVLRWSEATRGSFLWVGLHQITWPPTLPPEIPLLPVPACCLRQIVCDNKRKKHQKCKKKGIRLQSQEYRSSSSIHHCA